MGSLDSSGYKYWAFISYSSKDKTWGSWLHRAIEKYGIPAEFVEHHETPIGRPAPKRFYPLFRDRDELAASSDLGVEIEKALRASHYLIVICSPGAAQSRWVNKEIETFQELGRGKRVLAMIVDGEPNAGGDRECFPPALRHLEPIAADARPEADGKTNAKLKLLAGMLGVSFDALKQRDESRRRRKLAYVVAFLIVLLSVLSALTIETLRSRRAAQNQLLYTERELYFRTVNLAASRLQARSISQARVLLEGCPTPMRGWEWNFLSSFCDQSAATLPGQRDPVSVLELSPDGKTLAVGEGYDVSGGAVDYRIRTYDTNTWQLKRTLKGHTHHVVSISFSPDSRFLISGALDDLSARIWDLESGVQTQTLPADSEPERTGHWYFGTTMPPPGSDGVLQVLWEPHGRYIFTLGIRDRLMRVWDYPKYNVVRQMQVPSGLRLLCANPDGSQLAVYEKSKSLMQLLMPHSDTNEPIWELQIDKLMRAEFSNGGKELTVFQTDGGLLTLDALTGRIIAQHAGFPAVQATARSPDGDYVAGVGEGRVVKIWAARTGRLLRAFLGHEKNIGEVIFLRQPTTLVSGDIGGNAKVWNLSQQVVVGFDSRFSSENDSPSLSPDGQWLVTACNEGALIRNAKTLEPLLLLKSPKDVRCTSVAWSPRGNLVATGMSDGRIMTWDFATNKVLHTASVGVVSGVKSLAFSHDGSLLASSTGDAWIKVWRVDDLAESRTLLNKGRVQQVLFHPSQSQIFAAGFAPDTSDKQLDRSTIYLWDAINGQLVRKYEGVLGIANAIAVSPDGQLVAGGGATSPIIYLWNFEDGSLVKTLTGHEGPIWSLAFLGSRDRLVSGGTDALVKLWLTDQELEVFTLTDFVDPLQSDRLEARLPWVFARVCAQRDGGAVYASRTSGPVMAFIADAIHSSPASLRAGDTAKLISRLIAESPKEAGSSTSHNESVAVWRPE